MVRLAELTREQRSTLARSAGIADTDLFTREINRHDLETLAERPGDLLELAGYWKAHGKFASLAEMTNFGIFQKLTERDADRPDSGALSDIRAREGAERIAAALTLGKSVTLRVPSQDADPTLARNALDPADILPDWTAKERATLMRRGVFAPATYGRVRFHHRSTQEYLTAQWLRGMLARGCPLSQVTGLLFADPHGVRTAVPSMRPAAAWLALHDGSIRDELLEREPLVLMQHGDPASLPIPVRKRLLIVYAERQSAGDLTNENWDRRPFWMFADPALAPAVREAWARNTDPSFRIDLLSLVREGEITACVDLAHEGAFAADSDRYVRDASISAMSACSDHEGLLKFAAFMMSDLPTLAERDAAHFALHLFPKHLSRSDLIRLINESRPANRSSGEGFSLYIREFWARCPPGERAVFLEELAELCLTPPFRSVYNRVSARHRHLCSVLASPAADLVLDAQDRPVPVGVIKACAAIERSEERADQDDMQRLRDALRGKRDFHHQLFGFDVQEARRNRERDVTNYWHLALYGSQLWELSIEDAEWLISRLRDETSVDDRRVALSVIVRILGQEGLRARVEELRAMVAGVPELEEDLSRALTPPLPDPTDEEITEAERTAQVERDARVAANKQSWRDFLGQLRTDSSHLRDPDRLSNWKHSNDLYSLGRWLRGRTRKNWDEAARTWHLLAEVFGSDVAEAYRAGMKLLWRVTIPRAAEGGARESDQLMWTDRLSFYGIGLESDDSETWASRLTPDEAERAALHAVSVDEPSPKWIEALALAHPEGVRPIIKRQILSEWASSSSDARDFLHGIVTGGDAYLAGAANLIFDLVQQRPGTLNAYDKAVGACQGE